MRMGGIGPTELLLVVVVLMLIFGASKLGDIGGALGKSVKEFKRTVKEDEETGTAAKTDAPGPAVGEPTQQLVSSPPAGMDHSRPPDMRPS